MISKQKMMDCVYSQLAIDYNCSPDDFLRDGLIFTEAKKEDGRRPFPWRTPRLEMISMGKGVVINASEDILPSVRRQLEGKNRDEAFWMPFVYGVYPYFLPDVDTIAPIAKPDGFSYEMVEKHDIPGLYENAGLPYDANSPFPQMIIALARFQGEIAGMARATADCRTLWQICVDVSPSYRGKGVASALVSMLTLEVLSRGYIPYYFTSESNVLSMRVSAKAGYMPAWVHCYKTRFHYLEI